MTKLSTKDPQRTRRRKAPLPRIKFTVQLAPSADLDELARCVEQVVALEHESRFPDLIKFDDCIWEHDPRNKQRSIKDCFVSNAVVKERRELLRRGAFAGLPIRIRMAYTEIATAKPALAPTLGQVRFAVVELPVFWRHYSRTACKPAGGLFDVAYSLQNKCKQAIKVTPARSLRNGGLQLGNIFPGRCRPREINVPDRASWHLLNIRAIDSDQNSLTPPGIDGTGVIIGHPDTGWTAHPQLNFPVAGAPVPTSPNFPSGFDANTLEPWRNSASEPVGTFSLPGTQPQHGTRTASVMVSRRDASVSGVAPGATIFSIRCTPDVIILPPFLDDEQIGAAIIRAVAAGAQVISISLGGFPSPALHFAVQFAVASNVLVIAAAGNYSPQVVFPAAFPECIAVGASTADDCHWIYSSRDQTGLTPINIAAPGEFVRNSFWANNVPSNGLASGTSFSAAIVAGAAAMWLQFFGRGALIAGLAGRAPLQALFMAHLAATARTPDRWNIPLDGPGILNLQGLINATTLPNPTTFPLPFWVDPLGAAGATAIGEFNRLTAGPLRFVGGLANDIGDAVTEFSEEIWGEIISNPLVTAGIQGLEQAAQVAEDAVEAASNVAEDIAEDLQETAEDAVEFVSDTTEEIVETVAEEVSDTLSEAAGWFGF